MVRRFEDVSYPKVHTKSTAEEAVNPEQLTKIGELLFINHHSEDQTRRAARPDRKTISAHVQRAIRHQRRTSSIVRLRPSTFARMSLNQNTRDTKTNGGAPSPARWAVSWINGRCFERRCTFAAKTPFNSHNAMLKSSSNQTSEQQCEEVMIFWETARLQCPNLSEHILANGLVDSVLPGGLSKSEPAKVAFYACESACLGGV